MWEKYVCRRDLLHQLGSAGEKGFTAEGGGLEGPLRPSEGLSGLGLAAGWREELEGVCVPRDEVRQQRSYKPRAEEGSFML